MNVNWSENIDQETGEGSFLVEVKLPFAARDRSERFYYLSQEDRGNALHAAKCWVSGISVGLKLASFQSSNMASEVDHADQRLRAEMHKVAREGRLARD